MLKAMETTMETKITLIAMAILIILSVFMANMFLFLKISFGCAMMPLFDLLFLKSRARPHVCLLKRPVHSSLMAFKMVLLPGMGRGTG